MYKHPSPPFPISRAARRAVRSLTALPVDEALSLIVSALSRSDTARDTDGIYQAGRLLLWEATQAGRQAAA